MGQLLTYGHFLAAKFLVAGQITTDHLVVIRQNIWWPLITANFDRWKL